VCNVRAARHSTKRSVTRRSSASLQAHTPQQKMCPDQRQFKMFAVLVCGDSAARCLATA
jgi:hypothetical protein